MDDDPDDVQLISEALISRDNNCRLEVTSHGDKVEQYLETCKKFPDVILLDLNLPKKNGREVLTTLKRHDKYMDLPVVIFTTSCYQSDIDFCLSKGAEHFLTKPVTLEDYDNVCRVILNTITKFKPAAAKLTRETIARA